MTDRKFKAMVVRQAAGGHFERQIEQRSINDLPRGDLLIEVKYSSLNYKDALSASGNRGVTKTFPHTPGIDAAGIVSRSLNPQLKTGDKVIVTGYDLGMNTDGGFGQFIRIPADWAVPLPSGLSLKESMIYGTAGFTAALAAYRLIDHGLTPQSGDILVTGASGGVGSFSVAVMAREGFKVTAVSGKADAAAYLKSLGAERVVGRDKLEDTSGRLLLKSRWAGVIDTVGGEMLSAAIRSTKQKGAVIACGNAASPDLNINVYPFILRGISLIGIDSSQTPMDLRRMIWMKIANDWKLEKLDELAHTISLNELNGYVELILKGKIRGRVVIELK
jgi:acrylyl-CoA reductase (NADPH)